MKNSSFLYLFEKKFDGKANFQREILMENFLSGNSIKRIQMNKIFKNNGMK